MQIFEFHFNPKKEDKVFESFVFEPENVYEKKVGNLCIAGEITNILSQNHQLLNNLASVIKEGYYRISPRTSSLGALKKSLQEANRFLEEEEKKGNISWLGNLNIAVVSIKNLDLNFTKTGTIKILLIRKNEIIDIAKEIENKEAESPPLKTFSNIISGKFLLDDKLLILTKEIFDIFLQEGIFSEILSCLEKNKEKKLDKELRHIFNKHKKDLGEKTGLFLLILQAPAKKTKETSLPQTKPDIVLSSLAQLSKKKISGFKKALTQKIKVSKIIKPKSQKKTKGRVHILSKIKKIFIGLPKSWPKKRIVAFSGIPIKKAIILSFILIATVGIGFYIFQIEKQKNIQRIQAILKESQEIAERANLALTENKTQEANLLFQEAWKKISPLTENERVPLNKELVDFKKTLENKLLNLNKIEKIEPQLVFEIKDQGFNPQEILISEKDIYFFEPNSKRIYWLETKPRKGRFVELKTVPKNASEFQDSLIFLSSNNKIFLLSAPSRIKNLEFPYSEVNIINISTFGRNFYLLDAAKKEIIKFRLEQKPNLEGELWFAQTTEKPSRPKSMAIDGSIWILDEENNIWQYFKGKLKNKLVLNLFPFPKKITRIKTKYSLPYLYLLEPSEKRIIVLDKKGNLLKQFVSEKFDNLRDVSVDTKGTIYALDGKKLYRIPATLYSNSSIF